MTPKKENSEEKTLPEVPSHKYEEQSKTVTDKKGNTTTVKVTQLSDEEHLSTTITTNTTNKKKTQESHSTENSIKSYDTNGGYTEQTTTFSHNNTYDKKHNLTKEVRENRTSYTNESGALAHSLGKSGTKHSERVETHITSLDKKGNITQTEYHLTNSAASMRIDSKIKYSPEEKDKLKQEIHVTATAAQIKIENTTKKQKFSATLSQGTEHYSTIKGKKTTNVGIDSTGNLYGTISTETGNDEFTTKELSQKQLKKELQTARKNADQSIQAVTEAKNAQELTASIPSPMNIGNPMELGDLFNKASNQETYEQSTKDLAKAYKERKQKDQQPTALLMQQKLQNVK